MKKTDENGINRKEGAEGGRRPGWRAKIRECVLDALPAAFRTAFWLLAITVPVSFVVFLLKFSGILDLLARFMAPGFALLGLPGESAIVFATACLLNIYSCIAVIETLGLAGRTVTILALMCLISHNLPVESAVQKKTGTPFWQMVLIRLVTSFVGAAALNLLLPPDGLRVPSGAVSQAVAVGSFGAHLGAWAMAMGMLCLKIVILVTLLMIIQRLLEAFGVTRFLARLLRYPLMTLGVPSQAAFLWIVANTLGLAYGSGVMIDHVERGRLSPEHADILNHHIAISHSLIEDTLLFVAIGVPAWWITVPRVILAGCVVWLRKAVTWLAARSRQAAGENP